MVAAMSAGKLSATATKAKAKTSIMTISPFVWRKAPCSDAEQHAAARLRPL